MGVVRRYMWQGSSLKAGTLFFTMVLKEELNFLRSLPGFHEDEANIGVDFYEVAKRLTSNMHKHIYVFRPNESIFLDFYKFQNFFRVIFHTPNIGDKNFSTEKEALQYISDTVRPYGYNIKRPE